MSRQQLPPRTLTLNGADKAALEPVFASITKGSDRSFIGERQIDWRWRAASSSKTLDTVLTKSQLQTCANEVVNNAMVANTIDTLVFMINGDYSNFEIVANPERYIGATDQELRKIQEDLESDKVKTWSKKISRANERCKLWENTNRLFHSTFTFGRNMLGIERFPTDDDFTVYGAPKALKHLNSLRVEEVIMDQSTYAFKGIRYDAGRFQGLKNYKAIDLVPAFYRDNNVMDNTNYSGIPVVWALLSAAQVMNVILDEDLPESVRQVWAKFGIIFAGTSKKSVIREMKKELEASTWFIHNQKDLVAQVLDLGRNLMELPEVIMKLVEYIVMSTGLPIFSVLGQSQNYATAKEAMTIFKGGPLKRHRTWARNVLEDFWYAPMLADLEGNAIEDYLESEFRIKAVFPDVDFTPYADRVETGRVLKEGGVFTLVDWAKDIGREDIAARLKKEELDAALAEKDGIIAEQAIEIQKLRELRSGQQEQPDTEKPNNFGRQTTVQVEEDGNDNNNA